MAILRIRKSDDSGWWEFYDGQTVSGSGGGDMYKSTYDTDDDGKVESADSADSVPWAGIPDKPSTFTPSAHNHVESDITNLSHNAILIRDKWVQPITPSEGDVLKYTSGSWGPGQVTAGSGGGASYLDDLVDVTLGTPALGDYLRFNGSYWYSGSGGGTVSGSSASGSITVKETDNDPTVTGVTEIIVSAGTLTNNGSGSVTINTSNTQTTVTVLEVQFFT